MKNKKIRKLIQKPLRFHHQDIHEELDSIKQSIEEIKCLLMSFETKQQEK